MEQKLNSHSRKNVKKHVRQGVNLARPIAWRLFWKELGALHVRRAGKLLVILIISYRVEPVAWILTKIFNPFAGSTIPNDMLKGSRGSQSSIQALRDS
jgi:hypothetical protein